MSIPVAHAADLSGMWVFDNAANLGQARVGTPLTINGAAPAHSASLADDAAKTLQGVLTTVGGPANSLLAQHGIAANGGGARVNRWSIAMDILSPPASRDSDRMLFQTDLGNDSEGEYYIRSAFDTMGTPRLDFTFDPITESEWTRVVLTFDLGVAVKAYVDGAFFDNHTVPPVDDPRFSLDPAGILLFADDGNDNAPMHVGAVAIWDGVLTPVEIAALGKAKGEAFDPEMQWQPWGPDLVDPGRNTLYDVTVVPGSGGTEVWAVGGHGTLLHWNGSEWSRAESPSTESLRCVAMHDSNFGVAAGGKGAMLFWDGSAWSDRSGFTDKWIRSATMVSDGGNVVPWAAMDWGGVGSFAYWDGTEWVGEVDETSMYFFDSIWDMSMQSMTAGWAVGGRWNGIGQILRWDGARWNEFETAVDEKLYGMDMVSPSSGWAVGTGGILLRWDGSTWTEWPTRPGTEDLWDVEMRTENDGWAVGDGGTILRWNGSEWAVTASPERLDLHGVAWASADDAWAVGAGGMILRWNGSAWQSVIAPELSGLDSISISPGSDGNDIWAVGSGRTMYHWDGSDWQTVSGPFSYFYSASMTSASDGWAVGAGGRFYHYDGTTWNEAGQFESAKKLAMLSPTDGWAVGWGKIQHWDGATWTQVTSPTNETYYGMDALSADAVWAVGYGATICHYDGASWSLQPSPIDDWLIDVSMATATDGWIVGSNGIFLHWDGTEWTHVDNDLTYRPVHGVSVTPDDGDTRGWAVGLGGEAFWLEDGTWTAALPATSNNLFAVKMVSPWEAWAVGDYGVILHWVDPTHVSSMPTIDIRERPDGQVEIDWTSGTLESSTDLSGEWGPVPDAGSSPYIFTPQDPARFYRVRSNP